MSSFAEHLSQRTTLAERLCVGIDPHPATLTSWGLTDSADGVRAFHTALLEGIVQAGVSVCKPQVALFERHGVEGMRVLAQFIQEARARGVMVVADVKRGDIGSSLAGYADAWLRPGSDFESDAMTAVAYQGVGSLEPAFHLAAVHGKGVFVLAATSNPEGHLIQQATTSEGDTVATTITRALQDRAHAVPHGSPGWLGVVIGATVNRLAIGLGDEAIKGLSVLAPGFGAQGVALGQARALFGNHPLVIPTVSRSVAGDSPHGVLERIRHHLTELAAA